MSSLPIKDADNNTRKVDVILRTEGPDTVETQAVTVVDPTNGTPIDFATQTTVAALLTAANAIKTAAEALNTKTTAVNTGAIAGTVALDAPSLAALETITVSNMVAQGLTDTQLRASAVPISAASLPLPTGAVTQTTAASMLTALQSIDTDVGARADGVATDDTGTFSLISLFKRALGYFATLVSRTPALGAAAISASSPVSLPSDTAVGAAASIAVINTDLLTGTVSGWYDAANFHSVSIQLIGSAGITAGAVIFEQTNDTTNASAGNVWAVEEDTTLTPTPQIAAITIAASTTRMFRGPVVARFVRVRVSTAFAGANVQAVACFSQLPYQRMVQTVAQATAGNLNVTAAVTGDTAAAASADALANPTIKQIGADAMNFNGATWDRERNNANVTMGDTGAKTTSFAGATQTNYNARGAKILVVVPTVSGTTPTLTAQLQVSPDGGTTWLNYGPASGALTAPGNILLEVYPTNESVAGASPTALTTGATQTVQINGALPRTWRLNYTITGTTPSFTFTNAYAAYTN